MLSSLLRPVRRLSFLPVKTFFKAHICRGNWGVDLQAGAEFGYKLLFVVLLADLMAVVLQVCLLSLSLRNLLITICR